MSEAERAGISAGTLRPLRDEDVRFAAVEHRANFPEGFFARLGTRFLCGYYRSFIDSPHASAWVAVGDDDEPVGYLTGMTSPAEHRRHVLQVHRWRLAVLGGLALLARPVLLAEFLRQRARRYWVKVFFPQRVSPTESGAHKKGASGGATREGTSEFAAVGDTGVGGGGGDDHKAAVLAHIVVSPGFRERGLGGALIDRFVREAGVAGCDQVLLVTESGGVAARFYQRRCWAPVGERGLDDGRFLTTYSYPARLPPWRPEPSPDAGEDSHRTTPTHSAESSTLDEELGRDDDLH